MDTPPATPADPPQSYAAELSSKEEGTKEEGTVTNATTEESKSCKVSGTGLAIAGLVVLFLIFGLAVPITEVYFGVFYRIFCQAQRLLPIYLIVSAPVLFAVVSTSIRMVVKYKANDYEDEMNDLDKCCSGCSIGILALFFIIWLICGSVWVFGLKECSTTDSNCFMRGSSEVNLYCTSRFYQFVYWDIIIKWALVGFISVATALYFLITCFKGTSSDEPTTHGPPVALTSAVYEAP